MLSLSEMEAGIWNSTAADIIWDIWFAKPPVYSDFWPDLPSICALDGFPRAREATTRIFINTNPCLESIKTISGLLFFFGGRETPYPNGRRSSAPIIYGDFPSPRQQVGKSPICSDFGPDLRIYLAFVYTRRVPTSSRGHPTCFYQYKPMFGMY